MNQDPEKIGRDYYDSSGYYDKDSDFFTDKQSPFQAYRISNVFKIYTPSADERVVDLGCGWGTFCFTVAKLSKEVIGVDFSSRSVEVCNQLLAKTPFSNIRFVCADAARTGLPDASADVIVSADLFEHLYPQDFYRTLDECKRLLKSKGKLVIWTPHRGYFFEILKNHNIILKKDESHVDYKSARVMVDALRERGFSILKNYYVESHVPVLRTLERWLMPILPLARRRIAILAEKP